jgi:hypothetical protein
MAAFGESSKAVGKALNYVGASMKAARGAVMSMFGFKKEEAKPDLSDI